MKALDWEWSILSLDWLHESIVTAVASRCHVVMYFFTCRSLHHLFSVHVSCYQENLDFCTTPCTYIWMVWCPHESTLVLCLSSQPVECTNFMPVCTNITFVPCSQWNLQGKMLNCYLVQMQITKQPLKNLILMRTVRWETNQYSCVWFSDCSP